MPKRESQRGNAAAQPLTAQLDQRQSAPLLQQAGMLPWRRDVMTLLTFVRDNKVVGTQGAGNMPLKAVREVTARFVNPPKAESSFATSALRDAIARAGRRALISPSPPPTSHHPFAIGRSPRFFQP